MFASCSPREDRPRRNRFDDSPYLFDSRHDDPCASLGGSTHDPTDPEGRLLFNVLAMVAEFEPT